MRHNNKTKSLGRLAGHRKAMLANMACSLIEHKRINTTVAKGKVLRRYIEPLLTKAKTDTTHSRRVVFSYLQNKEVVSELFGEVASKIADRPGGYTRIIKTGSRVGDAADMCMIELVDFNEIYGKEEKKKTRRKRRSGAKNQDTPATKAAAVETPAEEPVVEDAVVVEEETVAESAPAAEASAPAEATDDAEKEEKAPETEAKVETPEAEAPVVEEPKAEADDAEDSASAEANGDTQKKEEGKE
ncbi:MAG: 50S ribosomal protein L17 [Crocinitomicaceae bacterium]|nr:50S ribosomal protein L17 [Crocinitomicaceae bacterium]|tara:strand:- start:3964 stop:4695 length:732 start_codon:yes stop_codon:yes gene_type:complete